MECDSRPVLVLTPSVGAQLKEPVYIFEPLFTELEREILPSYGCEVIKNNEVGGG